MQNCGFLCIVCIVFVKKWQHAKNRGTKQKDPYRFVVVLVFWLLSNCTATRLEGSDHDEPKGLSRQNGSAAQFYNPTIGLIKSGVKMVVSLAAKGKK